MADSATHSRRNTVSGAIMSEYSEYEDTEITLGTGRLLFLFFGLVMVCSVFFGLGFTLGRSASPSGPAPIAQGPAATGIPVATTAKPTAVKTAASSDDAKPSTSDELAFYKSADQKDGAAAKTETQPEVAPVTTVRTAALTPAKAAPEMTKSSATPQQGFVVQIAAVSKREDADALVNALRRKNYPVFTLADANDHLFHVQVGPFYDRKQAQEMKDTLAGDGYNPIVK
jgi:DedD protein